MNHLLILPILIPMLGASASLFVEHRRYGPRVQRNVAWVGMTLLAAAVIALFARAADGEILVYLLGDWPARIGIALMGDRLSAWMLLTTLILGSACLLHACAGWDRRAPHFSCVVPVPVDGLERCVLDRGHLQPVRVLRGHADRLLWPAAQRRAWIADAGRPALRGVQRVRVDVVPDCVGLAVRCVRHAQHGRAFAAHRRSAGAGCAAGQSHAGLVAAGVLQQGRVAAAVSLAAGNLFARAGGGGCVVRHHDQGRAVCNAAGVVLVVRRRSWRDARLRAPCAVVAGHRNVADGRIRGDGCIAVTGVGVVPGGVFRQRPCLSRSQWTMPAHWVPGCTTCHTAAS